MDTLKRVIKIDIPKYEELKGGPIESLLTYCDNLDVFSYTLDCITKKLCINKNNIKEVKVIKSEEYIEIIDPNNVIGEIDLTEEI